MASNCTNGTDGMDMQDNGTSSSHVCMPLSKMPISLAHGIIRSTVLIVFLVVAFIGNTVLGIVLQRKSNLMPVSNRFIFNLLTTDLMQVLLVAPWVVATSVPFMWPLNNHFCTALVSLTHLFAFTSVNTIVVVSIDRYLCIIHPLTYPSKMTSRRGYMLLQATWILALLQSTPPLYGWGKGIYDGRNAFCSMLWGDSPSYTIFSIVSFIIFPLFVMIGCYSVVFNAARRQHAMLYNAMLYNVKSHNLDTHANVCMENEREGVEISFQPESEFQGQDEGEVNAIEAEVGGMEVRECSIDLSEDSMNAKDIEKCSLEAKEGSVNSKEGGEEANHCRIDLGEDDLEFGDDDLEFGEGIHFSAEDIEAVDIQESFPSSRQNSGGNPPLPKCYQCKAARVIFIIIFSYLLSLGPYCCLAVLAIWVDVQTRVPQWVITIIIWLFFLQCCLHPYIYGYMHKTIRKDIQDMLKKIFKKTSPGEESHPDLPVTEVGTEGGRVILSHDSATSP